GPNPTPERSAETTENIPDQQPGKSAEKAQEKVVPAARENASLSRSVSDKTNQANAPRATAAKSIAADAAPAAATTPSKIKPAQPLRGGEPSLTRALGLKIGRILLDPGHGGHDTGTIGPSGYTEKELVLDVAQRLGKLIEERLGSEVLYTRE